MTFSAMASAIGIKVCIDGIKQMAMNAVCLLCSLTSAVIFSMGNRFEMFRIYASPIPAQMVNLKSFGNGFFEGLIAKTMGKYILSAFTEFPIAVQQDSTKPSPATIGLARINLPPKTDHRIDAGILSGHLEASLSGVMRQAVSAALPLSILQEMP